MRWKVVSFLSLFSYCISSCDNADQNKLFRLVTADESGIDFSNSLEETNQMNVLEYQDFYSGGGVSIGDVDNDGLPDIFFTGNQVPAKLYKNLGGLKFKDITKEAGLARMGRGWYTGTSMVDVNSDGHLDIYISKSGMEAPDDRRNLLFVNDGTGVFDEQAKKYGIDHQGFAVNASFFDFDNDNDLDIYLVNQGPVKLKSGNARKLRMERHEDAGDVLYENIDGKFINVTEKSGLYSSVIGFAHGVAIGDVNDDGWEDIFVSNDFFEYDYLYINNQDKTFTETIKDATNHISYYSMGNDMADYNNDGLLDIVVVDMIAEDNRRLYSNLGGMNLIKFRSHLENGLHHQYMYNVLHLNNGQGTFSDVGVLAGISRTDWSWAPVFADFDNDGWKDLYVTNGIRKDVRNIDWGRTYFDLMALSGGEHTFNDREWKMLLESMPSEPVSNYMFHNQKDLSFKKKMKEWGLDQTSWSNGMAYGDLDNDGDLDLVVNNIDQEAFVYENQGTTSNFLRITFSGPKKNPEGLGAKVRINHSDGFQYQQHYLARGYRSSMEPVMHFGLGKDSLIQKVEIAWPDGKRQTLENVPANKELMVHYTDAHLVTDRGDKQKMASVFQEVENDGKEFFHSENDMEDFVRSPLLPYKLSSLGPAMAVGDVNSDGKEDIYLGGSFRRAGQLIIQQTDGDFNLLEQEQFQLDRMYEDVGAAFFDADQDGDLDLYVVSGGNEHNSENGMLNDRLYLNDGKGKFSIDQNFELQINASGSVVKPFDYDNDGDLDLFVGGRQVPGSYPRPASSFLLQNNMGRFNDISTSQAPEFENLGMVTDALWKDIDNDSDADLIVVGEWMPITIFINDHGLLSKVQNTDNGLEESAGWWWSIEGGDFDNDGDIDLIAGNMGYNYKFRPSEQEPLEIYSFDFNDDGNWEMTMGYYQNGGLYPVYERGYALYQNREIADKIKGNDQYSILTLQEIYGKNVLDSALCYKMYTTATSYIENLGNGKFQMTKLGNAAQQTNTNSIIVKDLNEDGDLDLILGGNLYATEPKTIRNDAGMGMLLFGNGDGTFKVASVLESGLDISGDVRHISWIMLGEEQSLVAAKNNDSMQFFKWKK